MIIKLAVHLLCVAALCSSTVGQNLVQNGSFEKRDPANAAIPDAWTDPINGTAPLEFGAEHAEGAQSALLVADGKEHAWRQTIAAPTERAYTLSAMVKTEGLDLTSHDDYASIYGHIIYKGLAYSNATHFFIKIPPGTADWKRLSVTTQTSTNAPIEKILITLNGKLTGGRAFVDQV